MCHIEREGPGEAHSLKAQQVAPGGFLKH